MRNRTPPAKHPASIKMLRIWHKRLRESLLSLLLAMQIFILFVMPVVRAAGLPVRHGVNYTILLMFVSFAIILSRSRVAIFLLLGSVLLSIISILNHSDQFSLMENSFNAAAQVLTQLSLLWVVTTAVFSPGRITYHRIMGAVVMYLCIGMIFVSLNLLLVKTIPDALTNMPAEGNKLREVLTYYSIGTLTSSSAGNIMPVHPIARSLANLESICGQLFMATLLARIVGLHASSKRRNTATLSAPVRSADYIELVSASKHYDTIKTNPYRQSV